jgi:cysteine desulfurase
MIYLDNNATTRPASEVVEVMLQCLREHWGNPSSAHAMGRMPEGILVQAREQTGMLIGCSPAELVFTSGGTEAITQVFRGVFEAFPAKRHFIASAVEHSAVMAQMAWLKRQGADVTLAGVDSEGKLDLDGLKAALRPETALVSIMSANNETGVVFPIAEIASLVKASGALFHTDAVQAAGKMPLDVKTLGVDLLTLSAHKFHGPKGAGAVFIRRGLRLKPLVLGGHQERGRRGGTENVAAIAGMAKAAELALEHLGEMVRVRDLRDRLEVGLRASELWIHGSGADRVPNTSLLSFPGVEGEALLLKLDQQGICVSTGSACTTGQKEPSHVLRAMGVPAEVAMGTLRLSLSRETTEPEIDTVIEQVLRLARELRTLGPMGR